MLVSHNQVSGEVGKKMQTSGPTGWGRKQQCGWEYCRECVRALELFGSAAPKLRGSQVFPSWDWKSSMAENSTWILPWDVFSPASRMERTSSCLRWLAEKVPCQNPSRYLCKNQSVHAEICCTHTSCSCMPRGLPFISMGWLTRSMPKSKPQCRNPNLCCLPLVSGGWPKKLWVKRVLMTLGTDWKHSMPKSCLDFHMELFQPAIRDERKFPEGSSDLWLPCWLLHWLFGEAGKENCKWKLHDCRALGNYNLVIRANRLPSPKLQSCNHRSDAVGITLGTGHKSFHWATL